MCTGAHVDSAIGCIGHNVSDIILLIHLKIKNS